jgi:hypothetical protein
LSDIAFLTKARWSYAILDFLLSGVYAFLFLHLVPSRETSFTAITLILSVILFAGGIGMLIRNRWAERLAIVASLIMILFCAVVIILLISSAAYLHGIYGGVGEAGAAIAIVAALLAIEVFGLVPGLQLAFLLRQKRAQQEAL